MRHRVHPDMRAGGTRRGLAREQGQAVWNTPAYDASGFASRFRVSICATLSVSVASASRSKC